MEKILSMSEKKVVKWGEGYVVFLTPELKKLGLDYKKKVSVSVVKSDGAKHIKIEKIEE